MITVITAWYNESFLAPFFLRHYSAIADRIVVLLDCATNDNTGSILMDYQAKNNNLDVISTYYPEGMDEKLKVKYLNEQYAAIRGGYVINVDADEFVFCNANEIKGQSWDVAKSELINVYRNVNDKDLDASLPVMEQRRHGAHCWPYTKPVVVKAGLPIEWVVGNHAIKFEGRQEPYYTNALNSKVTYRAPYFKGSHWANADPCFCVQRRIERMLRQSPQNLSRGYSKHNHGITESDILEECKQHENDAEMF